MRLTPDRFFAGEWPTEVVDPPPPRTRDDVRHLLNERWRITGVIDMEPIHRQPLTGANRVAIEVLRPVRHNADLDVLRIDVVRAVDDLTIQTARDPIEVGVIAPDGWQVSPHHRIPDGDDAALLLPFPGSGSPPRLVTHWTVSPDPGPGTTTLVWRQRGTRRGGTVELTG